MGDFHMPRVARGKDTNDGKLVGITVRIPENINRKFSALLALNGETASGIFRECIDDYIDRYKDMINVK
jgi:predicted DNA-binding protein